MVNPNLKAKIEAAKSALEGGQGSTTNDQQLDESPTLGATPRIMPEKKLTSPLIADEPSTFKSKAAELDARITSLEGKLAKSQRDLYTLVGKIREVTRLQNNDAKGTGSRNVRSKKTSSDEQNTTRHISRRAAITLAIFIGIGIGTGFFLATDFINQLFVHLLPWIAQLVDFFSNGVR